MKCNRKKKIALYLILSFVAIICILPFYMMLMMSTQYTEDIYKGITLLPGHYLLENIKTVFGANFGIYYRNSLIVAISSTLLSAIVCTLCGYVLAKFHFKGRNLIFGFIMVTMMIPTQLSLVAFVVEMKHFGWMGTLLPLIIPGAASGFSVYWLRNYIVSNIPTELLESGRIDGAGEFRILANIVVPCVKPAVMSISLMNFVTSWNSYLLPLIVLNQNDTYTVPIGIVNLNSAYRNDLAAKITALSIGIIPLLILFLFTSKSFIKGITMGAVKG